MARTLSIHLYRKPTFSSALAIFPAGASAGLLDAASKPSTRYQTDPARCPIFAGVLDQGRDGLQGYVGAVR